MTRTEGGLTVLPPSPVEDEQRPLLDTAAGQPNHGTIQETQDGGESNVPIAEEASTRKIMLVIGCLWIGSFFAALGEFRVLLDITTCIPVPDPFGIVSRQGRVQSSVEHCCGGDTMANESHQTRPLSRPSRPQSAHTSTRRPSSPGSPRAT